MPQLVPIQNIPNQEFTVTLNGVSFDITLKTVADFTAATVTINGVDTIDGSRTPAGAPLLPYKYEENGNFIFTNSGGYQLPYYTFFNVTQFLVYYSASELATIRSVPPPVFNPIGALPLRYQPVGYTLAS